MAMKNIEDRFNRNYRYPWTFLNDEPFTDSFKLQTARIASGEVQYGLIPKDQWSLPAFIDEKKFHESMEEMQAKKIIYGGSESYRHSQYPQSTHSLGAANHPCGKSVPIQFGLLLAERAAEGLRLVLARGAVDGLLL